MWCLSWDPTRAYAQVLPPEQIEPFMTKIDFPTWNAGHDAGRAFAEGEADLVARFPDEAAAVNAYRAHFPHTLTGTVPGTGGGDRGTGPGRGRSGRADQLVGGDVSPRRGAVRHPAPASPASSCPGRSWWPNPTRRSSPSPAGGTASTRSGPPSSTTRPRNVAAATAAGLTGIHFTGAEPLRRRLEELGLLGPPVELAGPIYHLAVASQWTPDADYPWSSRGVSYDAEGYVHCSFPHQVAAVRSRYYGDLADEDLLLLELDVTAAAQLLVAEDLGTGEPYPHLYAPLTADLVRAAQPL